MAKQVLNVGSAPDDGTGDTVRDGAIKTNDNFTELYDADVVTAAHIASTSNPHSVTKAQVGLGNVDNTSNATERAATATLTNKTLTAPVVNSPTGIVKADVGLGNVDNTSNTTERAATATLTNKTLTSPVINSPTGLAKADVGLSNVDNTSDSAKPVSSAQQTALNLKEDAADKGAANGYASLGADSKIPTAQLPALAITDTFIVASQAAQVALTAEVGDICIRTDQNKSYILKTDPASTFANWSELLTPTDTVLSVNSLTGAVTLTTANIADSANKRYVTDANLTVIGNTSGTNTGDNPGVTSVTGSAPIVSSGGNTPAISISAATTSAAGSLSAADKTTLDGLGSISTQDANAVNIDGGNIDGTVIGASTPAAATTTTLNTTGAVVFNEAGADVDFRVEGDTNANLLVVDASADAVGIGTAAPLVKNHTLGAGTAVVASGSDGAAEAIIEGANIAMTSSYGNLNVISNTAQAADTGGQIAFAGKSTDSDNKYATWAVIKGAKENATSANIASYLAFSTRADGAGNTEKLRITSAGNVGIGGADTSLFNGAGTSAKLTVIGSSNNTDIVQNGGAAITIVNTDTTDENTAGLHFARADTDDTPNYAGASIVAQFKETQATGQYPSATLNFLTSPSQNAAPTLKMTLTEAGNLGIGTAAPAVPMQIGSAGGVSHNGYTKLSVENGDHCVMAMRSPNDKLCQIIFDDVDAVGRGQITYNHNEDSMSFASAAAERMRITSAGHLLVGTTDTTPWDNAADSTADNAIAIREGGLLAATRYQSNPLALNRTGNNGTIVDFRRTGTIKGTIGVTTTAVSYNTTSDYRLKENVKYDWSATERLKKLKPARFNFIADPDTTVDGFLAHEAQEVVPESVTGVKDEVDEDGEPVLQGIDQAKLVPLLVKTIQELEARIAVLEAKK